MRAPVPLILPLLLLTAACGEERLGEPVAAEASFVPATETPTPTPGSVGPVTDDIPDDFRLELGTLSGPDFDVTGPSPGLDGVSFDELCETGAWPGSGTTDRLALRVSGPEYGLVRELVTYADAEQASAVVDALRAALLACTTSPATDGDPANDRLFAGPLPADTGYESSLTFGFTYRHGFSGALFQVVPVGRAVLATVERGELGTASLTNRTPGLTDDNREVTDVMRGLWATTPTGTPTPTPSPAGGSYLDGFPLALGYDDENGDDHSLVRVTGRPATQAFDLCNAVAWDPAAGSTDVLGVEWRGEAEWARGRTLVLYGSTDDAQRALVGTRQAVAGCPEDGSTHTLVRVELGDDSVAWTDTYWESIDGERYYGTGLTVYHLVRVGRALLLAYEYGEGNGSDQSRRAAIEQATELERPVIAELRGWGLP